MIFTDKLEAPDLKDEEGTISEIVLQKLELDVQNPEEKSKHATWKIQ